MGILCMKVKKILTKNTMASVGPGPENFHTTSMQLAKLNFSY